MLSVIKSFIYNIITSVYGFAFILIYLHFQIDPFDFAENVVNSDKYKTYLYMLAIIIYVHYMHTETKKKIIKHTTTRNLIKKNHSSSSKFKSFIINTITSVYGFAIILAVYLHCYSVLIDYTANVEVIYIGNLGDYTPILHVFLLLIYVQYMDLQTQRKIKNLPPISIFKSSYFFLYCFLMFLLISTYPQNLFLKILFIICAITTFLLSFKLKSVD